MCVNVLKRRMPQTEKKKLGQRENKCTTKAAAAAAAGKQRRCPERRLVLDVRRCVEQRTVMPTKSPIGQEAQADGLVWPSEAMLCKTDFNKAEGVRILFVMDRRLAWGVWGSSGPRFAVER